MAIGNHLSHKMRISRLHRDQWAAEIAKLPDDAQAELRPWFRIEYKKLLYADQIKEQAEQKKEHEKLVSETKRKKR